MKKKSKLAIKLKNINKSYILKHEKPTFVENIMRRGSREAFQAINNLSLEIKKGEKIGIIGKNGSGKTTLLKIIAGITTPDSGEVFTNGKVVSLIDLEAGFHPDLTGEENIFLNGMMIGMSRSEINRVFKDIVKFASIGKFIDAPVYTYSAGMMLRLGFSIAVYSNPDILLLDEGVAAGDEEFRNKANKKIQEFFLADKTVIIVSHWLEYLKKNCKRFIWIDDGIVKNDGSFKILYRYKL